MKYSSSPVCEHRIYSGHANYFVSLDAPIVEDLVGVVRVRHLNATGDLDVLLSAASLLGITETFWLAQCVREFLTDTYVTTEIAKESAAYREIAAASVETAPDCLLRVSARGGPYGPHVAIERGSPSSTIHELLVVLPFQHAEELQAALTDVASAALFAVPISTAAPQ